MIAHKVSSFSGLLKLVSTITDEYCRLHRLPILSVIPDDGSMEPESKAAFNYKRVKLMVSPRLINYIKSHTNYNKVWAIYSSIRHELRHYEQYIHLRRTRQIITKNKFDENEATIIGRTWADDRTSSHTLEEINPIRYVDGYQWGTRGKVYPKREQALRQMRAVYWGGYRGRNPKINSIIKFLAKPVLRKMSIEELRETYRDIAGDVPTGLEYLNGSKMNEVRQAILEVLAEKGVKNPTLVVPIKSKKQMEHLYRAQSQLAKAGVTFDTGTRIIKPVERHWELDWSLKGAKMKNPTRKPTAVERTGNILGGMGLLTIPIITGLILWIQSRQK